MVQQYDYIIVGQGLAGSVLAWMLIKYGSRVLVIDQLDPASASRVAAGILNPVSGQRMSRAEETDQYVENANAVYDELEHEFKTEYFHSKAILRVFQSGKEARLAEKRFQQSEYREYLEQLNVPDDSSALNDSWGSVRQKQTGYLDMVRLLDDLREYFRRQDCLHETRLNYADVKPGNGTVCYKQFTTRQLIFCEGAKVTGNPWFADLPFEPSRGEILSLESDEPITREFISRKCWLLPLGDTHYKLGATYCHEFADSSPTDDAKSELLQCLSNMFTDGNNEKNTESPVESLTISGQQAGIRPNTSDRYPFIGHHPEHPELVIFNGFGSKGVLTVPWYATCLTRHLLNGQSIPAEASTNRIYDKRKQGSTGSDRRSLVERAHALVAQTLKPGNVAIDATVGNGYDTVFLAKQVGDAGKVFGFDIQPDALTVTRKRLQEQGLENRVELHQTGHEYMDRVIRPAFDFVDSDQDLNPPSASETTKNKPEPADDKPGKNALPKVIMFNLGYRPGSDKTVTTKPQTTVDALSQAITLLAPGGLVSILIYRGHPGGQDESKYIFNWLQRVEKDGLTINVIDSVQASDTGPVLIVITKS